MQDFPIDSYLFWVMGFEAPASRQPAEPPLVIEPELVLPPAWMIDQPFADQPAFTADA